MARHFDPLRQKGFFVFGRRPISLRDHVGIYLVTTLSSVGALIRIGSSWHLWHFDHDTIETPARSGRRSRYRENAFLSLGGDLAPDLLPIVLEC